jgi:hypothetical protein
VSLIYGVTAPQCASIAPAAELHIGAVTAALQTVEEWEEEILMLTELALVMLADNAEGVPGAKLAVLPEAAEGVPGAKPSMQADTAKGVPFAKISVLPEAAGVVTAR